MKRNLLIKYLNTNGCTLLREGGRHSVFINNKNGSHTRHPDINDYLAKEICKELDIPKIRSNQFINNNMTEKEHKEMIDKIVYGLKIAEREMLEEKARNNEDLIVSS